MFRRHPVRSADRGVAVASAVYLAASSLIAGCTDFKKSIGLEPTLPDEFAVESRAPLTIPPDFDLRPPSPGAPRPQEKAPNQQAKQAIEQAGPGEPGGHLIGRAQVLLRDDPRLTADPGRLHQVVVRLPADLLPDDRRHAFR